VDQKQSIAYFYIAANVKDGTGAQSGLRESTGLSYRLHPINSKMMSAYHPKTYTRLSMADVFTRILRIELPESLQCDESGKNPAFTIAFVADGTNPLPAD
jgi:hypothetical protein